MNQSEKINEFLQTRGYDLKKIKGYDLNNTNVINKALTKQEAIDALSFYHELKVPILGGDVFYLNQEGEIKWTYDNWYCIKKENENNVEYLKRSIDETVQYINNYKNNSLRNCIFLFDIVYKNLDVDYDKN